MSFRHHSIRAATSHRKMGMFPGNFVCSSRKEVPPPIVGKINQPLKFAPTNISFVLSDIREWLRPMNELVDFPSKFVREKCTLNRV